MTTEELTVLVKQHVSQLMEHVDSVQIFVTIHTASEDSTKSYETGAGNFYTRFGQITEWLSIQDQYQRQEAKRRASE